MCHAMRHHHDHAPVSTHEGNMSETAQLQVSRDRVMQHSASRNERREYEMTYRVDNDARHHDSQRMGGTEKVDQVAVTRGKMLGCYQVSQSSMGTANIRMLPGR